MSEYVTLIGLFFIAFLCGFITLLTQSKGKSKVSPWNRVLLWAIYSFIILGISSQFNSKDVNEAASGNIDLNTIPIIEIYKKISLLFSTIDKSGIHKYIDIIAGKNQYIDISFAFNM